MTLLRLGVAFLFVAIVFGLGDGLGPWFYVWMISALLCLGFGQSRVEGAWAKVQSRVRRLELEARAAHIRFPEEDEK